MYRIGVTLYGNAAGYVGAINQTLRSTTRLSQGFRTAAGQSKLLDNQLKAIGTTARYALAGTLVFGVTGAINKLQDFENQLGTIDSLAGTLQNGKLVGLGNKLQDIGSDAIVMSDKFGQSVTDVEAYMARFTSTFNRRPGESIGQYTSDLQGFTGAILDLQAALGTEAGDPNALAGGIGGLINVIPGGRRNITKTTQRIGNLIAYLTQVTPNFGGQDVANAAGRIASIYNVANMSPEQIFAVLGQAAKSGGSPTITVRGVTQLIGQSLLNPRSPKQLAAYRSAGLPTDATTLRDLGGLNVLERLMQAVAPNGVSLNARQRSAVNSATTQGQLQAALPGLNLTELMSLFGRIQSVQQFINILSQGGVQGLKDYIKSQKQATEANLLQQRAQKALNSQGQMIMRNAFGNLSLSLVRGLNEPMTQFGKIVAKVSDELAMHRTTTSVAEGAAVSAVAARVISSTAVGLAILKKMHLGFLSKAGSAAQKAAGAAIIAEETSNVAAGLQTDGTRGNPFWVIISPYSWQFGYGGLGQPVGGGKGGTLEKAIKKTVGNPLVQAGGVRATATALGVAALPATVTGAAAYEAFKHNRKVDPKKFEKAQSSYMLDLLKKRDAAARNDRAGKVEFGTAKADLTIKMVDKNGDDILGHKVTVKGVPIAVTKDSAPQSQGRPGVKKGK